MYSEAPSLSALQDMLNTCAEYAASHNLRFSTDPNPKKCKTKLMAFLKKPRNLPELFLCGNPLPWVDQLKHLGNTISNTMNGNQLDIKIKRAKYIDKNNSLLQEFHFAHPQTKVKVNNIFNNHFTGSQLWKFGSNELEKFESTYNKSIKIMYDLPVATHRFFIEPLSGVPHMRRILVRRYLSFIENIRRSSKVSLNQLLELVQRDVRMTTGANLRLIMIMAELGRIEDLNLGKVDFEYHKVKKIDEWKIGFVQEIVDVKQEELNITGMDLAEIEEILEYLCTS